LAPAIPQQATFDCQRAATGAGVAKQKAVHTSPEHDSVGSAIGAPAKSNRVASVAEAKHGFLSLCWQAQRCVVLRTPATRGFFGTAKAGLLDLAIVDGPTSSTASGYGPAGRWTERSAGLQGTTRRPNSRKMRWSKRDLSSCRSHGIGDGAEDSWWFQPGRSHGPTKLGFADESVPGVRGRRVCVGPIVGSPRASCTQQPVETIGADDAATGSR
jgi:hypothetical protein